MTTYYKATRLDGTAMSSERELERAELERERRECLEQDPPMTGHHSYLTERLRELESER